MNIVNIIRLILIFLSLILSISCFINLSDPPLFLFSLLSIIFYLILYFFTFVKNERIKPLLIYFNLISILWIGIRIAYLSFRYEAINYKYIYSFSKIDVCISLILCIFFTLSLNLGLIFGSRLRLKFPKVKVPKFFQEEFEIKDFLKVSLISTILYTIFSVLKIDNKYEFIISFILPMQFIFWCLISVYIKYSSFLNEQISSKMKLIFYFIILLTFYKRTFIDASKGAILDLSMQFLSAFLVINKTFFIKIKYLYFGLIAILFSVPIYFLAYGIRFFKVISASYDVSITNYLLTKFSFSDLNYFITNTVGGDGNFISLMDNLSRRVSYFDYLNIFFHGEVVNQYMSLKYSLKVIFNSIFPRFLGLNFSEAELFPSRLFKVAYGYENFMDNLYNYHTDHIPLYGFLYANFSLSAILIIFVTGVTIAIIYRFLSSINIDNIHIFSSIFIFYVGQFIFGLGISETFQFLLYNFIIATPTVYFINYLIKKFKFKLTN
tara:strand:+ start:1152 stop:2630 length:1479 start_codon:yes stop_codon:yes gene_type:complete